MKNGGEVFGDNFKPSFPGKIRLIICHHHEKAVTVDFEKHPARKVGTKSRAVDPMFAAGLPFPVPEVLEFKAFRDS